MLLRSKLSRRNLSNLTHATSQLGLSCRHIHKLAAHLPPLPPHEEWNQHFATKPGIDPAGMLRPWIYKLDTQFRALEKFGLGKDDGIPKTIIEMYPGPGNLSRAILSLPKKTVKRLILMEHSEIYHPQLEELAAADDRVVLLKQSAYTWDAFEEIKRNGTLSHIDTVLDGPVHPQLRLLSQLPLSASTEQLVSQWIRTIPVRAWIWSYGRVPIHLFIDEWLHHRLTASSTSRYYGKLTVLAQALATISDMEPASLMTPYEDHWYPPPLAHGKETATSRRYKKPGHPMVATTLLPRPFSEQPIQGEKIDAWDFVLRNAFVLGNSPVKKALAAVAPGAASLLDKPGTKFINPKTAVRKLTIDEWTAIMHAFNEWPFAPKTLVLPDAAGPRLGTGFLKDD